MSGLLWPGDERAGELLGDEALLTAMVSVEAAWLAELVDSGLTDLTDVTDLDGLAGLVGPADLPRLARGSESGGNPVIPLVAVLRERIAGHDPGLARWVHTGLTSQDVLDSALMLCIRDVGAALAPDTDAQLLALADLAEQHRATPMVARTLTQHALPYTFGLKVATWLDGVLDAVDDLATATAELPAQLGGAVGTRAALTELHAARGRPDPAAAANAFTDRVAARLGLRATAPWATNRATMTRIGDAWCRLCGAWGRIANDVLTLSRPEIGEVAEPAGRGGSSTLPHKANPVLSVLIRRAALAAPAQAAQLHLAAAEADDERPDGAWHLEWPAIALLGRHTLVAGAQTAELVSGLQVDPARMLATLDAARSQIGAEQRAIAALVGASPQPSYDGVTDKLIAATVARARTTIGRRR